MIQNITFVDTSPQSAASLLINLAKDVHITDLVIQNLEGSNTPIYPFIFSAQVNEGLLEINGLTIQNAVPYNQQIFGGSPSLSNVSFTNFLLENCTLNAGIEMFFLFTLHKIDIQGIRLDNVKFDDPTDTDSSIINVNQFQLNNTYDNLITGIDYSNSSVTVFKISRFENILVGQKLIQYTDSTFADSSLTSQRALIGMNEITSSYEILFEFDNITFTNINFAASGFLFNFNHQLPHNLSVTN